MCADGQYETICRAEFGELHSKLDRLDEAIRGNGKPGIQLRLDRLEQTARRQSRLVWLIVGVLLSLIVSALWQRAAMILSGQTSGAVDPSAGILSEPFDRIVRPDDGFLLSCVIPSGCRVACPQDDAFSRGLAAESGDLAVLSRIETEDVVTLTVDDDSMSLTPLVLDDDKEQIWSALDRHDVCDGRVGSRVVVSLDRSCGGPASVEQELFP